MMKTEAIDKKISGSVGFIVLFLALFASAALNYSMTSSWISTELFISGGLVFINFLITLYLDHKALTSNNFLLWGMLFKMAKSFMVFIVLAIVSIAKLVSDPKLLACTFLLGCMITMIFEVINLQKFTKKKED